MLKSDSGFTVLLKSTPDRAVVGSNREKTSCVIYHALDEDVDLSARELEEDEDEEEEEGEEEEASRQAKEKRKGLSLIHI